ncbi:MAG TPA: phospholipase D family protein [Ktedonobacteraceae bacterium]|nr:phospholipase D family protein [Ktedonobacteraceae bacterium]
MRHTSHVAFLIDGRTTMLEMCLHFLSAKHSIYITAWGLTPELLLVRGKHNRAGPDGSPEQEELLAWLRKRGLEEQDLLFWKLCEEMSVTNVLSYAASKGVDVRILLWDTYTLPFTAGPKQIQEALEARSIRCLLDDSHKSLLNNPIAAHHQKTAVVDSRWAFVGGIDMMTEANGEKDRWDTKGHPYHTLLRADKDGNTPVSWHDVHILFEGPAVADVELNFRQRWNAVIEHHQDDTALYLPDPAPQPTANTTSPLHKDSSTQIQVTRTIPKGFYDFAPEGINTILETYLRAFARARHHIYIENQYFWRRAFFGMENPLLGIPHAEMDQLIQALADALLRGVVVSLVLPDNPNVGREFTDEGLQHLCELAPRAIESGMLHLYTLACSYQADGDDHAVYRSIYVHGKIAVVDDLWLTIGSANLNNRGMCDDTETNVIVMHPEIAQGLRMLLMAEHLGFYDEDTLFRIIEAMGQAQFSQAQQAARFPQFFSRMRSKLRSGQFPSAASVPSVYAECMHDELGELWTKLLAQLGDPSKATALLAQQAQKNLLAVKAGQLMTGHLLPYIPAFMAEQYYEVQVDKVNGWLDTLPPVERA